MVDRSVLIGGQDDANSIVRVTDLIKRYLVTIYLSIISDNRKTHICVSVGRKLLRWVSVFLGKGFDVFVVTWKYQFSYTKLSLHEPKSMTNILNSGHTGARLMDYSDSKSDG